MFLLQFFILIENFEMKASLLRLGIVFALEDTSNQKIDDPSINIKGGLIRQLIDSIKLFHLNCHECRPHTINVIVN